MSSTRLGLGVVDGRFSLLALSPKREVIAAAPVIVSEGHHFSQLNGLGPIRAALRMIFTTAGISALFQPGTLVRTSVGRFEIIDAKLFYRYSKCEKLRRIISLSQQQLSAMDIHTVDVMNGQYLGTLSMFHPSPEYVRLSAKHPSGF